MCLKKQTMVDEENQTDLSLQRVNTPKDHRIWRSWCLRCDREIVQYFTKYIILIGLMCFFAIELHISTTCEEHQLYQSLLTLVLGIALPNPRLKTH